MQSLLLTRRFRFPQLAGSHLDEAPELYHAPVRRLAQASSPSPTNSPSSQLAVPKAALTSTATVTCTLFPSASPLSFVNITAQTLNASSTVLARASMGALGLITSIPSAPVFTLQYTLAFLLAPASLNCSYLQNAVDIQKLLLQDFNSTMPELGLRLTNFTTTMNIGPQPPSADYPFPCSGSSLATSVSVYVQMPSIGTALAFDAAVQLSSGKGTLFNRTTAAFQLSRATASTSANLLSTYTTLIISLQVVVVASNAAGAALVKSALCLAAASPVATVLGLPASSFLFSATVSSTSPPTPPSPPPSPPSPVLHPPPSNPPIPAGYAASACAAHSDHHARFAALPSIRPRSRGRAGGAAARAQLRLLSAQHFQALPLATSLALAPGHRYTVVAYPPPKLGQSPPPPAPLQYGDIQQKAPAKGLNRLVDATGTAYFTAALGAQSSAPSVLTPSSPVNDVWSLWQALQTFSALSPKGPYQCAKATDKLCNVRPCCH